jgi:hypothetical protein
VSGRLAAGVVLALVLATVVPAAASAGFQPYQAYPVGSWPEAVAIGDVTGDGRNDVVMTTHYYFDAPNDYRLWVFEQQVGGTLAPPVSYATAATYTNGPDSVAIGDITGDGRNDVVLGLTRLGVQVFPQLATGGLGQPAMTLTNDSHKIALGQLDADGRLDVAGIPWGTDSDTVSVMLNDGAGGLRAPVVYPVTHDGYDDLEIADVTGDARDDLVVMSGQGFAPNVSVVPQLASGGFGPAAEYRVPEGTWDLTHGIGVGDVTGDGRNDVVASYGGNTPNSWIAVFAQNGSGTLNAPVSYPSYDIPEPVDVADLDLDGRADVVTLHGGWSRAGMYRQQSNGVLATETLFTIPYASHYNPHGLAVGDLDGNGSPDLAIADYNHGLVVLRNTGSVAPPPPPPPPVADLRVDVTASAARVKPKKSFSFTAVTSNAGPAATDVTLVVRVVGPATGLAVSGQGCTLASYTVTCSFAGLAAGGSRTVQVYGTTTVKGGIVADAQADGSADDPNAANNTDEASIQVR